MEYNPSQLKVINANESKIVCLAASASGKTRTLTARVERLLNDGVAPEEIVAITFTRLAADEMKRRIGDKSKDIFIGTVHSYANKICMLNGVKNYSLINQGDFDNIINNAVKIPVENYPKIKHLLIDESQDLTALEFSFIDRIPTENIFFVGDDRQNIYGFRGGTDKFLRSMKHNPDYKTYYLLENYRNAPNILDYAESLLSGDSLSPNSRPVKKRDGILEDKIPFMIALEDLIDSEDWGSWFILTRTNDELDTVREILTEKEIPMVSFKMSEIKDNEVLDDIVASDAVKVLTIHCSKGLENKNVIVIGMKKYNEEERKIGYVAATRAENALYVCSSIKNLKNRKKRTSFKEQAEKDPRMISFE